MEKTGPWCGQPSDRGRLKERTDHIVLYQFYSSYLGGSRFFNRLRLFVIILHSPLDYNSTCICHSILHCCPPTTFARLYSPISLFNSRLNFQRLRRFMEIKSTILAPLGYTLQFSFYSHLQDCNYRVGQKNLMKLITIIICQILIDVQNSLTARFCSKFAVKWLLKISPHLIGPICCHTTL